MSPYHPGELAVQERLGQERIAERVGRTVKAEIPAVAADFLAAQPLIVVAAADAGGRPWATQLTGTPGFVQAIDPRTIDIDATPVAGDPLHATLDEPCRVGLIALQPQRRRRMRVNGPARRVDGLLRVVVDQVYSNCPKYISRRELMPGGRRPETSSPRHSAELEARQRAAIEAADAFFIASVDSDGNADASHRGGNPGFVRVLSPTRLCWPDYRGNSMFMTLGNIMAEPRCGLLIPDWTGGGMLQLTGRARIDWETTPYGAGAQCGVDFTVDEVVELPAANPLRWSDPELSPANP
ncbi:pyridoxamine 5-phosphate oxidase [Nocardia donostiensis]|uniref:pyridoxamine 5'-phosphate oxidase family protein n=1 Tax=Nocardia donostiensis TaxID=1538463 RepID=UPI0009D951AC|nr:pyridoxamine 5'-phosphate oxidase family protein [Nocardia donostiensis]OQS13794.1 pyridoxamine 5-phosphate oxidase [Nocardia donostiensis]